MEGKREIPKLRGAVDLLKVGVNPIPQPQPQRRSKPEWTSLFQRMNLWQKIAYYALGVFSVLGFAATSYALEVDLRTTKFEMLRRLFMGFDGYPDPNMLLLVGLLQGISFAFLICAHAEIPDIYHD
jgi:hypothetical protein